MSSDLKTRYLSEEEYDLWDQFVDSSSFGTIFQKSVWLNNISKWQNLKFSIAGCFKGQDLIGGMAFTWERKYSMIPIIHLPVKTPFFGIVLPHSEKKYNSKIESQFHSIIYALISLILPEFKLFYSILSPENIDIRPYIWLGFNTKVHYSYRFELNKETDLISSFDYSIRKQINKGKQINHDFYTNCSEDFIGIAWKLEQKSFDRQKFKFKYSQLNDFKHFIGKLIQQDSVKIYTITHQGKPIASRILILDRSKRIAYDWLAGIDKNYLQTGLNQSLMLYSLEDLINSDFKTFDFGGAGTKSIAKYKSKYNFKLVPYYSVSKSKGFTRIGLKLKDLL